MNCESFDEILNLIEIDITKEQTTFREPIGATERLAVTLRNEINVPRLGGAPADLVTPALFRLTRESLIPKFPRAPCLSRKVP
ncbi:hypothetical protein NQ318_010592 [Aromia moschata]|uniref:Uncharacterized protein n=1 Tax=Aromia moschata TaxID=1265417 RepID=A0AAV8X3H6_9CUCU|nr:hypothetical protein NQ318_010592 [Aromia moschata]